MLQLPRTLAAFVASLTVALPALAATTTDYVAPPSLVIGPEDAELEAAEARARQSFGQFLRRLKARSSADLEFAVQARVVRGDVRETVWLSDVRVAKGNRITGRVHSDPILLSELRAGDGMTVLLDQVTDWVIVEQTLTGERVVGGFTVKLLRERELRGIMPEYLAHDAGVL